MSTHAERLPHYLQLREAGVALNSRLVEGLSRSAMNEAGRRLNMLDGGTLVLDSEDMTAVLMDYCIHDVRRYGVNAVERHLNTSPPAEGSDEWVLLHALRASQFSVFAVEAVESGVGVGVRDLLRDTTTFLADVGLGTSGRVGMVFAMRVMVADGIGMTTGAALLVGKLPKSTRAELVADIRETFAGIDFHKLAPEEASDFAAAVLRTCLDDGAGERTSYIAPEEIAPPARRPPPRRRRGGR
ncbi:hypothetical protein R5W24_001367 [Gemmata sp. JC717]|uniref:hypothetical protein n=1 Tax=Gemmata algarum TaxID=2975278 RepID=UPI0021BB64C1|nr:hypothetical protein [Gemmata algarum]MDY3552287.1 hypothetical protein [Gemmata algarum]